MTTLTWHQYPKRAPDPRWADNWEDDPERLKHQDWLRTANDPRRMDDRQKRHHGITGLGAFLRRIIKENT